MYFLHDLKTICMISLILISNQNLSYQSDSKLLYTCIGYKTSFFKLLHLCSDLYVFRNLKLLISYIPGVSFKMS